MGDNMESNLSRGAQAVAHARANADFSDEESMTESMHDTALLSKESGGEQEPTDALTRLRRQKRLAMNRESARARRKRKKCLIESLEEHVAELTQKNRRYQIATENLTAKVNKLESDLEVARSTITYLSNQNQQPRADMLSHMSPADLGLSGMSASGPSPASRQGGFQNRLLQSQALSHSQLGAGSGYGQSAFLDDHRLRQHALDLQIAQASRDNTLGSVIGRYAASQQDMGFNAYGASAPGLQRPTSNNTLALPLEIAGDMRLGLPNMAPGVQGAGLADALSPNQSRSAATSQILSDYLKHGDSKYASKGEKKQLPW